MDGDPVRADWQGALPFHYHYGGTPNTVVRMQIQNNLTNTDIWQVKAYINGTSEAHNKVMIGNHRDAWVFGAVDPGSGKDINF